MPKLPEEIIKAWENREQIGVLATVDEKGVPNAVYVGCMGLYENWQFVVADNYFDKTRKNILNKSKGTLLFKTKEGKSYQVKGTFSYEKQGKLFDYMKSINPTKHPGHAAAILNLEEAYSGARKLL